MKFPAGSIRAAKIWGTMATKAQTLGELRRSSSFTSGADRRVKDEIRANLLRKLEAGEPLFPGVHGYEETVLPQIANALLARHNFILLGLRGQAKSRILRGLIEFPRRRNSLHRRLRNSRSSAAPDLPRLPRSHRRARRRHAHRLAAARRSLRRKAGHAGRHHRRHHRRRGPDQGGARRPRPFATN